MSVLLLSALAGVAATIIFFVRGLPQAAVVTLGLLLLQFLLVALVAWRSRATMRGIMSPNGLPPRLRMMVADASGSVLVFISKTLDLFILLWFAFAVFGHVTSR